MYEDLKKENIHFPKDFWTRKREHVTKPENAEDMIPFNWSKDVLNGNKEAILYSAKKNNKKDLLSK